MVTTNVEGLRTVFTSAPLTLAIDVNIWRLATDCLTPKLCGLLQAASLRYRSINLGLQVQSALHNGLYKDMDVVQELWEHAFK